MWQRTHPHPISYPALPRVPVVVLLIVRLHEVVRGEEGVLQQLVGGPAFGGILVQAFLEKEERRKPELLIFS